MLNEPIDIYHAHSAISHSKLETFRRRPALYHKRYVTKQIAPPEPTAAFRIGSASHCMMLEPLTWPDRYAVKPEGLDRRTSAGKAAYAEFEAKSAGKIIIDADDASNVLRMTEAARNHPLAAQLLAHGQPELTWRTEGAFPLQCRTDWYNPEGCELTNGRPYILDLKTVESLDDEAFGSFAKVAFRFGYHRQAGFYLPLISEISRKVVSDFFFLVVEKAEPYGVAVYRMTDEAIAKGQDETVEDLKRLQVCYRTNVWPNIEPVVQELALPKWYKGGAE